MLACGEDNAGTETQIPDISPYIFGNWIYDSDPNPVSDVITLSSNGNFTKFSNYAMTQINTNGTWTVQGATLQLSDGNSYNVVTVYNTNHILFNGIELYRKETVIFTNGSVNAVLIPYNLPSYTNCILTAGEKKWFYFDASNGDYYITCDDVTHTGSTYTADIKLTVFRENMTTIDLDEVDRDFTGSGYVNINSYNGRIYIVVEGVTKSESGSFGIRYWES